MPDILTPEERAAIAAFPLERIRRIPVGASAHDGPVYVWKGNAEYGVLVHRDKVVAAAYRNGLARMAVARNAAFRRKARA